LNDGSRDDARSVDPRSQHAVPSQCYDDRFNAATEQGFCSGFDVGNGVRQDVILGMPPDPEGAAEAPRH